MSSVEAPWMATVSVRTPGAALAEWLERSLQPEATREVPRARAEVRRRVNNLVEVTIWAQDSGAMRAALNTYLGWVHLSLATARTATQYDQPDPRPT